MDFQLADRRRAARCTVISGRGELADTPRELDLESAFRPDVKQALDVGGRGRRRSRSADGATNRCRCCDRHAADADSPFPARKRYLAGTGR
ncbi:MAG: hypothetical protein ACRYGA_03755 [Janthinobacterium lividum]